MTERELHKATYGFFNTVLSSDVIWHHAQNETPYGRTNAKAFKGRDIGSLKGFPDWVLFWRDVTDTGKVGFIELKAPGKYPSPEQRWFLDAMRQHGHMRAVCKSLEDVEDKLTAWGVPMKGRVSA